MGRGNIPPKSVQLPPPYSVYVSYYGETNQATAYSPCEGGGGGGGGVSAEIKSMVECKQDAKAPVAEVDGYDTVC